MSEPIDKNLINQKKVKNQANHYSSQTNGLSNTLNKGEDGVFEGGMLGEAVVFGELDKKDKWKVDSSNGDTYTDVDGEVHPWTRSRGGTKNGERWFDTRTNIEKTVDSGEKALNDTFGVVAAPITGLINMGSNANKIISGGGQNKWTPGMSNPANKNRGKAALTLGTDVALMAATGGLPGAKGVTSMLSKVIPKKSIFKAYTYLPTSYKKANSYYRNLKRNSKNPLGESVTGWVQGKAKNFLKHDKSGKYGTVAHNIAEEMADFNGGVTGTAKHIITNYVDNSIKDPLKAMFRNGGLLYKKFYDGGHFPETDWRGNNYTPGENNIHQAYENDFKDMEGFDMDKMYKYFAAVGAHEGKGNMVMAQDGGGPGRGMFQIENNSNGGDYRTNYEKFLRTQRLKTPEWYSKWEGNNVSNLGKSEQLELMMSYNFYGNNKKNLARFMSGEISAGQLAAINHKRKFTPKGEVGEYGYMTKEQMEEKYIEDTNKLFSSQSNSDVNSILFDNDHKIPYKNTPDNTNTYAGEDFGYRCGDGKCALNDKSSGPVTLEEQERVKQVEIERKKDEAKYGNAEDIMLNKDTVRPKDPEYFSFLENGGLLYKK